MERVTVSALALLVLFIAPLARSMPPTLPIRGEPDRSLIQSTVTNDADGRAVSIAGGVRNDVSLRTNLDKIRITTQPDPVALLAAALLVLALLRRNR